MTTRTNTPPFNVLCQTAPTLPAGYTVQRTGFMAWAVYRAGVLVATATQYRYAAQRAVRHNLGLAY